MLITLWTVRIACLCYGGALAAWLMLKPRAARLLWTAGLVCYLAHVAAAFSFQHHWSHREAYEETARQTAALFRIHWGGGLYFNYAFTAIWTADVVRLWWKPESSRLRAAVHVFLAFMFFNAVVVFGSGWIRWSGVAAAAVLTILWKRRKGRLTSSAARASSG